MIRKIAIIFAFLAVANAALQANSPSSVFAVAPGKVFTNGTDTAFTALTGPCYYTGGFDNTTNYVWCQTATATATVAYTFQRRAINASSPATINSTSDAKLTSTQVVETNGMVACLGGTGYFGFAVGYAAASAAQNVILNYAAVNATSFTKVTLTSNSDVNIMTSPEACMIDNGIFYVVYSVYVSTSNKTQNGVWIQAVNATAGAVYYNSTGGVKLFAPTTQDLASTLSFTGFVGNNQTNSATLGLLTYTDASGATTAVGSKYNLLPITLSSGAAGSIVTLATGAQSTVSVSSATYYSTSTTVTTDSATSTTTFITTYLTKLTPQTGTVVSTVLTVPSTTSTVITTDTTITGTAAADTVYGKVTIGTTTDVTSTLFSYTSTSTSTTTSMFTGYTTKYTTNYATATLNNAQVTTSITTSYSMSAFGSLSTYGVILVQEIESYTPQVTLTKSYAYANSLFINGSSSASSAANLTNPSGYALARASGFSTNNGFLLLETFASTSGGATAVYKDTYYYNGTQVTGGSASLGTFESGVQGFSDATGSVWIGYTAQDSSLAPQDIYAGYAGEVLYQTLSAKTLSSFFATLALMIAALFAF